MNLLKNVVCYCCDVGCRPYIYCFCLVSKYLIGLDDVIAFSSTLYSCRKLGVLPGIVYCIAQQPCVSFCRRLVMVDTGGVSRRWVAVRTPTGECSDQGPAKTHERLSRIINMHETSRWLGSLVPS